MCTELLVDKRWKKYNNETIRKKNNATSRHGGRKKFQKIAPSSCLCGYRFFATPWCREEEEKNLVQVFYTPTFTAIVDTHIPSTRILPPGEEFGSHIRTESSHRLESTVPPVAPKAPLALTRTFQSWNFPKAREFCQQLEEKRYLARKSYYNSLIQVELAKRIFKRRCHTSFFYSNFIRS